MDQEGAASSAPDEGPPVDTAVHSDVVSGNATVEPGDEQTVVETPENPVCDTVKEEEVDFNPEEENDIVEEFLGVEVETLDLLDIGESGQPSSSTLPAGQGAAVGAPEIDLLGDVAPPSTELDTSATTEEVAVGSSPSAPSKPPRTRGARGGKDKVYKDYRRVFYQGFERLKDFLAEHLVSRPGRSNFNLQWIDFERAPQRLQELLINWQFFRNGATIQQILCEAEFLIGQVAHHVGQHGGYNGEGPRLAQHIRDKTPTIESLYTDDPEEQRNYSQAWRTWQNDPVQEPIRRRVGAKSKASGEFVAKGAAPSAPDRSTSVGSWVGRGLLPPPKKGKGSSIRVKKIQQHPCGNHHLGDLHQRFFLCPPKLDHLLKLGHRSHQHHRFVCPSSLCNPLHSRGPLHQ